MRLITLLILAVTSASCQTISVGIKAGIPLGDPLTGNEVEVMEDVPRYLVGGTVEAHVWWELSLEVDAIYKRTGYTSFFQSLDIGRFTNRVTANQWEFPLLVKYSIREGRLSPFVDAGPVLRHISGIHNIDSFTVFFPTFESGTTTTNNTADLSHRNSPGFAVGGGVRLRLFHIRISPEIRYTRWGSNSFNLGDQPASSNPNQVDLIAGFTF